MLLVSAADEATSMAGALDVGRVAASPSKSELVARFGGRCYARVADQEDGGVWRTGSRSFGGRPYRCHGERSGDLLLLLPRKATLSKPMAPARVRVREERESLFRMRFARASALAAVAGSFYGVPW